MVFGSGSGPRMLVWPLLPVSTVMLVAGLLRLAWLV